MATQSLSTLANLIPKSLSGALVYAAVEYDPLLAHVPVVPWGGDGSTWYYDTVTGLPTSSSAALDASSYSSTAATYGQRSATLKNLYTQGEVPLAARIGAFNKSYNVVQQTVMQHGRSLAAKLLDEMVNETSRDVTIGATATTKGVNACVPSPNMSITESSGILYFDFDDTGDLLKLSSDGGVTYGPQITLGSEDLNLQPMFDASGDWCLVSFDVSDSATGGNWTTSNAATGVTVASSTDMDGFAKLVQPDNVLWGNGKQIGAANATGDYTMSSTYQPSANGDAFSLKQLDRMINKIPWAKMSPSNCAFVMHPRTAITFRHTVGSGSSYAGATVREWMGRTLADPMLGYMGIPILENPNVTASHTVGTSTDCTQMYLLYLDGYQGYSLAYANAAGSALSLPVSGSAMPQDAQIGSPTSLPFYARWLPENASKPWNTFRADGYFSGILRNDQAIAATFGITD